ncbi:MAG TPA: DUF5362 family protein [Thermoanaerobaculia bacterium]|nr:DUF5362 family protein [Thermoanaerobaculia bacterium]
MEPTNPYTPPGSPLSGPPRAAFAAEGVGQSTLGYLKDTKPWVRMFSILGFIGSAFAVLAGLLMMVGSSFLGEEMSGAVGVGMGLGYILFAVLYIMPSLFLWRYASAIQTLLSSRRTADLDEALKQQKSFWRFIGLLTAVLLVIYALILVGVVVFGAIGAAGALGGGG